MDYIKTGKGIMTNQNDDKILSNHYFFVAIMNNGSNTELLKILNKRLDRILKEKTIAKGLLNLQKRKRY